MTTSETAKIVEEASEYKYGSQQTLNRVCSQRAK